MKVVKTINGMVTYTDEEWLVVLETSKSYQEKRAEEYPPMEDYNDAMVKQHSSDPVVVAEGVAQEQQYYDDCLAIKEKYPKPTEE